MGAVRGLLLNRGRFRGQQIVPEKLLRFHGTEANPGYGFTAWLNRPNGYFVGQNRRGDEDGGWIYPEGPSDLFMAAGAGQNRLYMIPSRDMVVVRFGESRGFNDARFLELLLGPANDE